VIKINKPKKAPNILVANEAQWTQELIDAIDLHGSYSKLPKEIKALIAKRYKHQEIKEILVPNENTKCAFCESKPGEAGYTEVEHFLPKSIHPGQTYKWTNLLPCCKRCNLHKLDLDTGILAIVKPDEENPEDYFAYNNIKIVVKDGALNHAIAERTIERLDLNERRLLTPRANLLISLTEYEEELRITIDELTEAQRRDRKARLVSNIQNSLDKIDELKHENEKFAGFCRNFINGSTIIDTARNIVAEEMLNLIE